MKGEKEIPVEVLRDAFLAGCKAIAKHDGARFLVYNKNDMTRRFNDYGHVGMKAAAKVLALALKREGRGGV